jgi:hypothetical protein
VACLAIVLIVIYLLISHTQSDKEKENTQQNSTASVSSDSAEESDSYVYSKIPDPIAEGEQLESRFTKLYSVADNTPFYIIDTQGNNDELLDTYTLNASMADGVLQGMYTGHESADYSGYIQLDYKDGAAIVKEEYATEVDNAKALPIGIISQITENQTGYSGCGAACLHMMLKNTSYDTSSELTDYETLLNYAENNGFADMGSLLSSTGGMSAYSLMDLAKSAFGFEMLNAYDTNVRPSDTLKAIIDGGRQAIVLVKHNNGSIVTSSDIAHFIVVTGYISDGDKISFVYANSYYSYNSTHGNPLNEVDSDLLDTSASAQFEEPNAILYIK